MCENGMNLLEYAKQQFSQLMQDLNKTDQEKFFSHILKEWKPMNTKCHIDQELDNLKDCVVDDPAFMLNSIALDIRKRVPFSAVLPSEEILLPTTGQNSDCKSDITIHVDEFLYEDNDVDELVENGQLKRSYCVDCGSKNIKPLIFISHSMSREALYHIFNDLLPLLKDKTILDVGSRLGAVLYGAYVYTDAKRIIGVEMNGDFCQLQSEIVLKYQMNDRIEIVNKRIEEVGPLVKESHVIVINNSFEFYLPTSVRVDIWKFLKANMQKGTILVTQPPMEIEFDNLETGISIDEWLRPYENPLLKKDSSLFLDIQSNYEDRFSDIACYQVI